MSKTQWLYNTRINTRELPEMLALGKRLNKPVCILAPLWCRKDRDYTTICR